MVREWIQEILRYLNAPIVLIAFAGMLAVLASWRSSRRQEQENSKLLAYLTGGDDFPIIEIDWPNTDPGVATKLSVKNCGKNPLYSVTVKYPNGIGSEAEALQEFGDLYPSTRRSVILDSGILVSGAQPLNYEVEVFSMNGVVKQKFFLRKVNGQWREATCVTRVRATTPGKREPSGSLLYRKVDDGYPSNEIPWRTSDE